MRGPRVQPVLHSRQAPLTMTMSHVRPHYHSHPSLFCWPTGAIGLQDVREKPCFSGPCHACIHSANHTASTYTTFIRFTRGTPRARMRYAKAAPVLRCTLCGGGAGEQGVVPVGEPLQGGVASSALKRCHRGAAALAKQGRAQQGLVRRGMRGAPTPPGSRGDAIACQNGALLLKGRHPSCAEAAAGGRRRPGAARRAGARGRRLPQPAAAPPPPLCPSPQPAAAAWRPSITFEKPPAAARR